MNKVKEDLLTRDYDLHSIEDDPRFVRAFKEFWIVTIWCGVVLFAMCFIIYGIDWSSPANYSYILGFPAWFAWAMFSTVIGCVGVVVIAQKVIKDCSLEDIAPESVNEEAANKGV